MREYVYTNVAEKYLIDKVVNYCQVAALILPISDTDMLAIVNLFVEMYFI